MKPCAKYQVIGKLDPKKVYSTKIFPRYINYLSLLRRDQKFTVPEFIKDNNRFFDYIDLRSKKEFVEQLLLLQPTKLET